jgi:hypothetical protein
MLKKAIYRAFLLIMSVAVFGFNHSMNIYAHPNEDNYKLIRTFEKDTTGTKKSDMVKILADVKNKGYIVEIEQYNGKTYTLKPAGEFEYLAPYTTFWDINIQIADINNDTVPEIITWGQMTHENAIHIFRWNGSQYKIVYSGFNTDFDFKDTTGDKVLELIIDDRIYGTGDEFTYYKWQNNQYKKINYELVANRGFEKIQNVIGIYQSLHAQKFLYSDSLFESSLKEYFTQEWTNNESNIAYLKEFGKDLFSIQIAKYINEKLEYDYSTGEAIKDTWKLKVLAFKIQDIQVVPKEMVLTVVTKRGENNEFKIDYINFSDSDYSKDSFYQSVNYNPSKGILRFTIPEIVPVGYRFYLHVSGRMYMDDKSNGMSFHAFDDESENFSWEKGKTYTYSLKSENLDDCLLVFGLICRNNQELLYVIHISPDGTKSIEKNQ